MIETFLDGLDAFASVGIDGMGLGIDQGAELNDELLEADEI